MMMESLAQPLLWRIDMGLLTGNETGCENIFFDLLFVDRIRPFILEHFSRK
jgi:hypothetical protein